MQAQAIWRSGVDLNAIPTRMGIAALEGRVFASMFSSTATLTLQDLEDFEEFWAITVPNSTFLFENVPLDQVVLRDTMRVARAALEKIPRDASIEDQVLVGLQAIHELGKMEISKGFFLRLIKLADSERRDTPEQVYAWEVSFQLEPEAIDGKQMRAWSSDRLFQQLLPEHQEAYEAIIRLFIELGWWEEVPPDETGYR